MLANRVKYFKYLTQQPYDNLCWAACVAMIARWLYRDPDIDLERVTNTYLNNGKQAIGGLYQLNHPVSKDEIPQVFESNSVNGRFYDSYLVSENVKFSIDNNSPILVCLESLKSRFSGHVLIIVGYNSDHYVVHDPYTNSEHGLIDKDRLQRGYEKTSWVESWYDFDKLNG